MMKTMSVEGTVGGSVTDKGKASLIGEDVQTDTHVYTDSKMAIRFPKIRGESEH